MVNLLLREGAMTDEFKARFGLETTEPIPVRFIRTSPELAASRDHPSKLSRNPALAGAFLVSIDEQSRQAANAPARVENVETHSPAGPA